MHAKRAVTALLIGWQVAAGAAGCGVDDLNVSEGTPSKKDGGAGTDASASNGGSGNGTGATTGNGGAGATGPGSGGALAGSGGAGGRSTGDAAAGGRLGDAQSDAVVGPDGTVGPEGGTADACNVPNTLKCAGPAQKVVLICDASTGKWRALQSCDGAKLCDTRAGATLGSCQDPDPLCAGKTPGDKVCSGQSVYACGPDLIDRTLSSDCQGSTPACLAGACVECAPNTTPTHCKGSTPQYCDTTGHWVDSASGACASNTPACLNGTCGTCTPNPTSTECEGNTPRYCDATGAFASATPCANPNPVCVGGSCVECNQPSPAQLCNGATPRTCDTNGSWKNGTTCSGGTPVCRDGTCVECVPNAVPTRCSSGTPQYCDATGHWKNVAAACSGATSICLAGDCVACTPNPTPTQCLGTDTPQFCNSTGAWENKAACAGSTPVCMSGNCVDCTPSVYLTHCSATGVPQFCDTSGHWKDGGSPCPSQTPECVAGICKCSGIQCGASCLIDDPANCGFCGHSCQGAACTGGFCDVTVVASNQNQPSGLSIEVPSYLYWTTTGGTRSTVGTLNRLSISSGTVTELAGGLSYPTDVLAAGGSVYFTELGSSTGQGKVSKWTSGQPIQVLVTGQTDPISLAWNPSNANIYWGSDIPSGNGPSIQRWSGSPPPVSINPYASRPFRMFIGNPNIYWIQDGGGAILVSPLAGGTMGVAVSTASGTKGVSLAGVQAYVTVTGGVWRYPLNSSAPAAKSIASGQSSPYGITTDGVGVYWTNAGDGTVMRGGLDGGTPHVLARNQTSPGNIVVNSTHVFWVNRSSSGSVMKVAK